MGPAPVPVSRETFGIPREEDPWSQVPDPSDPLATARAYFEHFLKDNGGLRKENDGEPRRYANGQSTCNTYTCAIDECGSLQCASTRPAATCMGMITSCRGNDGKAQNRKHHHRYDARNHFAVVVGYIQRGLTLAVFFDFRRGRSKYYRDVLGIDNGKVSTLASQDWQAVKVRT